MKTDFYKWTIQTWNLLLINEVERLLSIYIWAMQIKLFIPVYKVALMNGRLQLLETCSQHEWSQEEPCILCILPIQVMVPYTRFAEVNQVILTLYLVVKQIRKDSLSQTTNKLLPYHHHHITTIFSSPPLSDNNLL